MRKSLLSLTILTLGSVAMAKPAPAPAVELEPLQVTKIAQAGNFMPGPGRPGKTKPMTTLSLLVQSPGGCTDPTDFEVKVKQDGGKQIVSILRVTEDNCRRAARIIELELESRDLLLSSKTMDGKSNLVGQSNPIVIANPLPVEDNTTH